MEHDMMDSRSNPNMATRSELPGDRMIAALEASTDRMIAWKGPIWRLCFGAVAMTTIALAVLVFVSRA
ncbi:hypothetical protein CSW59_00410 [Caulobacter sp. BP25]|nr:hypothetical protein CSW59_00410 [Caulobacter sp. BP25]